MNDETAAPYPTHSTLPTPMALLALLAPMHAFVLDEQRAAQERLAEVWARPLPTKLARGQTQALLRLERGDGADTLHAWLGDNESRLREGDFVCLHQGDPFAALARRVTLERDDDDRWLLRCGTSVAAWWSAYDGGPCWADPDALDLTPWYLRSMTAIAESMVGKRLVLPLLAGDLELGFRPHEMDDARGLAVAAGLTAAQAEAVALAYGAEHLACIHGPPGTGKTRTLALAVRLMAQRGERVLVTSHTHTAINHALNHIARDVGALPAVPMVKVGRRAQGRDLSEGIETVDEIAAWPPWVSSSGPCIVGATPFACCSRRLDGAMFDTVVFDEASQVTVPLAMMAMRRGQRFVFVGDDRQLPPVMLSRSVLDKRTFSAFARLTADPYAHHAVMLDECWRMNRELVDWPSRTYYGGKLRAVGPNASRSFPGAAGAAVHVRSEERDGRERHDGGDTIAATSPASNPDPEHATCAAVLDHAASRVFVPTLDPDARTLNHADAALVATLCALACERGLPPGEIGVVTPYRAQGRAIRAALVRRLGRAAARAIVADTVERMQGQERELVILSLASGDGLFLAAIADFFFQPERLNVAITRARTKLVIVGPRLDDGVAVEAEHQRMWLDQYRDLVRSSLEIEVARRPW